MTPPSERVRRILSDAPPPREEERASPQSPTARSRALRERLEALGLERSPSPTSAGSGAPAGSGAGSGAGEAGPGIAPEWVDSDDDRPLEAQVEGRERETPQGAFLYVEKRLPLTTLHGRWPLDRALAHAIPLRAHETHPDGPRVLDAADAVFLDTETTGLAGGTGTVAFLVGTGRVEGESFVVRQYCMRDYPEEPALLHALLEDLGDAPLVTFNGRSFDWPLLTTRLSLHRMKALRRTHYDLLPPSRRIWVDSVPSHTLGTLEEQVLGLTREGDLPGWRIPQAFFDYLRTGQAGLVALAFAHNVTDVVSMLALFGEIGGVLATPDARPAASARDQHGTARLLLDLGDEARAGRCLEAGIRCAATVDGIPLRRLLGHLHRRAGRFEEALTEWRTLAREAPHFDVESFEQVAKIYEHRHRDYAAALAWVEEALNLVSGGSRAEEAFRHRAKRLRRKHEASTGTSRPKERREAR